MGQDLSGDASADSSPDVQEHGRFPFGEVPVNLDVLPESGREVVVLGDVQGCKELNHRQGDNPFGFRGTCGLVSCEDVLRQFDIDVTEGDVVRHALLHGLCDARGAPSSCGGTTMSDQTHILTDAGVPAHAELGADESQLAEWVAEGRGVIIEVNAGELWDDPSAYDGGNANHAVTLVGAALDPGTGALLGFYINDSGRGYAGDSGRFVSAELMQRAWVDVGGAAVVTDAVRAD